VAAHWSKDAAMVNFLSDDVRRNPFPIYAQMRQASPVFKTPMPKMWMLFDYENVHRALVDHETFSSKHGPVEWLIFQDPPRQSQLRALISRAFTPRSIVNLEPRIRELTRELLGKALHHGEMDLAEEFAVPLPMRVIAEMLGIPSTDLERFTRWNDVILEMSHLVGATPSAETSALFHKFLDVTAEMREYLAHVLERRHQEQRDDLLTRLAHAEIDGQRLTHEEILGFFQLLLLAGSETTTNLINNAILCFIEHPDQLELLRRRGELLENAIEEVLRFRSPLQWMYRVAKRDVQLGDQTIPQGDLVLAVIGSANRDAHHFADAERFDITRDPNLHLAFGHGTHFCLGAPLARLEAKIALGELLMAIDDIQLASDEPWPPRKGLHVHGPSRLPIRFTARTLPVD
jgi:cytochrome P450